ncbi:MogA/MoaB family molybdenum cofactor biosynthesis protein [Halobacillus salinus]|uniref:Molybdenum cofactor biosynthesis protein B n=1 Tax=Halobacillus salinus TaxID=192814 RepID=A0A4Z0H465_9BACI|nr:MogA/MoaB family molybdenum cofactor biosynthesis protein [Halobacillus salinus]TGB04056.1 MogA/MoaB family molybdenum cofactor biosynthesis protein [Halobacillus salinus]
MAVEDHKKHAPARVRCMVVTISDTRTEETDKSGKLMMDLAEAQGHQIVDYRIVKDEFSAITEAVQSGVQSQDVDVILTNGGTGIAKRDVTIEAVQSLIDKEIPGFGELFRMLSYTEDIGSTALLSRAVAGAKGNKAVFSTPGSSGAVRLAMGKLIVPELAHVVRELNKDS